MNGNSKKLGKGPKIGSCRMLMVYSADEPDELSH